MGKHLSTWDLVLPMAEFVYNSSINRSSGLSLFKANTSCKPKKPIDLPIPIGDRPSASAESFVQHVRDFHTDIHRHITCNNDSYKSTVDLHKRKQKFAVRDEMMLRRQPERFPHETRKKLHARCIVLTGSCRRLVLMLTS